MAGKQRGPSSEPDPPASGAGAADPQGDPPSPVPDGPSPTPPPEANSASGGATRNLAAPKAPAADPTPVPPPESQVTIHLTVELVRGDIVREEAPVAVVGHYKGLKPNAGALKRLDDVLGASISHAVEFGMIGSGLGELFFIPVDETRNVIKSAAGKVGVKGVLLAGMGEPGRFGRDDLRLLMTNVTYAMKTLGYDGFSMVLIGSGVGTLSPDRAVRATLDGINDGLERLPGKGVRKLRVLVVEHDQARFRELREIFREFKRSLDAHNHAGNGRAGDPRLTLKLKARESRDVAPKPQERTPSDLPPSIEPGTRITITTVSESEGGAGASGQGATVLLPPAAAGTPPPGSLGRMVFQYSAMSEAAVIPVREVPVHSYFIRQLPERVIGSVRREDQEAFGKLMANYTLPEDFLRLIEGDAPLTLVLDRTTAYFPWEMAGFKGYRGTSFFGPDLRLTRQFRTLMSAAPGVPPALNYDLKALVIADPAPNPYHLPGAREEGLAVVDILKTVHLKHQERQPTKKGDRLRLNIVARIGSYDDRNDPTLIKALDDLRGDGKVVSSAKTCDPLDVLALLLNEQFDIVHYAGHGVFEAGRKGWVFGPECTLSAEEIFRVRQVPRLVFANACHSSEVNQDQSGPRQQVSLAEAFFARGIQNYIGAGWAVDDVQARVFARLFYSQVLGVMLDAPDGGQVIDLAPPATLGDALANARSVLLRRYTGSTWGAYQHYGQVNAKLVPFPNLA